MPLVNEQRDVVSCSPARSAPDPEIVATLKREGHALDPGPASYSCISAGRSEVPGRLERQVSGPLDRPSHRKVTLFNDRSGLHRVYYHESADAFILRLKPRQCPGGAPRSLLDRSSGIGRVSDVRLCPRKQKLVLGYSCASPGSAWTFRNGALGGQKIVFSSERVGTAGATGSNTYYETLRNVYIEEPSSLLQEVPILSGCRSPEGLIRG